MRILMAPVNIAGQPIAAMNELRRQGVDVSLLQYTMDDIGHRFGYAGDQYVNVKGRHRLTAHVETLEAALESGYDIFHFWMATLFGGRRYANMYGLDLPFIKARGRRVIYRGTGFDLRVRSQHIARNPHHPFQHGYELDIDEDAQALYLDYLRSYVDQFIVQDPEMHEFMPQARVIPRGIDLDTFPAVGITPTDRPLVVHAPSKGEVKGTSFVVSALEELAAEGLVFDFKLVTGMAHEEAMNWYRRADVIVDQLLLGWYGVLSLEGLALGKPVVVYVREDLFEAFTPRIPIANANPDTVKDVLRTMIESYDARRAVAEHGPQFAREVHDIRKVAAQLREVYTEVMDRPIKQPEGYADLHHFLAQYKQVEALEERRKDRFQANKYRELLGQLPAMRFKVKRHDELVEESKELRRQVRQLGGMAPAARGVSPAPARGVNDPTLPDAGVRGAGAGTALEIDDQDIVPNGSRIAVERGLLRGLRSKARQYDAIADELPRLRYQAKRAEELAEEMKSLQYKARRLEELSEELPRLRYQAKRAEELQRELNALKART